MKVKVLNQGSKSRILEYEYSADTLISEIKQELQRISKIGVSVV